MTGYRCITECAEEVQASGATSARRGFLCACVPDSTKSGFLVDVQHLLAGDTMAPCACYERVEVGAVDPVEDPPVNHPPAHWWLFDSGTYSRVREPSSVWMMLDRTPRVDAAFVTLGVRASTRARRSFVGGPFGTTAVRVSGRDQRERGRDRDRDRDRDRERPRPGSDGGGREKRLVDTTPLDRGHRNRSRVSGLMLLAALV